MELLRGLYLTGVSEISKIKVQKFGAKYSRKIRKPSMSRFKINIKPHLMQAYVDDVN